MIGDAYHLLHEKHLYFFIYCFEAGYLTTKILNPNKPTHGTTIQSNFVTRESAQKNRKIRKIVKQIMI